VVGGWGGYYKLSGRFSWEELEWGSGGISNRGGETVVEPMAEGEPFSRV